MKTALTEAGKNTVPVKKRRAKQSWMTNEILDTMDKRKQAKNNDVLYAEVDSDISRKCKLAKEKWWNNKCDDKERLEAMNRHQEMHDKIKEITGTKKKSKGSECIKDKEGNMLFNENDIKKR